LDSVVQVANRLKQSPGFIAFAGRYLYVTPTLIAHVAFEGAWNRWIEADPARFLGALPPALIDHFMQRVQSAGTALMRETVSNFFFAWATKLGPPDLGVENTVLRLVRLVEVQPETFLPLLRGILDRTPPDEIRQLHSSYPEGANARRQLVWLAEKLAHFPEAFGNAEAVLLRLAVAESEPHLGNNASSLWAALFRIFLSGTATPFSQRLSLLEERLRTADAVQRPLALAGLSEMVFDESVSRLALQPVLFGRIPPQQWRPADETEHRACHRAAVEMMVRLTTNAPAIADSVRALVVRGLSRLLLRGYLNEVRAIIGPPPLSDTLLAAIGRAVEDFLSAFCRDHELPVNGAARGNGTREPKSEAPARDGLGVQVREWYQSLVAGDLHSRLVSVVGQDFWRHQLPNGPEERAGVMNALAEELLRSPENFERELKWLSSAEARSAFHFGQAIAHADPSGKLLDRMLGDVARTGGIALARGYMERVATTSPELLARVNGHLDQLQVEAPKVAFDLIWASGDEVRKVERIVAMIDTGALAPEFLRALDYGVRGRPLTEDELFGAIERLVRAAESGNTQAAPTALHLLYGWLRPTRRASGVDQLRASARSRAALPRVLELSLTNGDMEPNFWLEVAEDFAGVDAGSAVSLVAKALSNSNYNVRSLAASSLADLAREYPEAVMRAVGEAATSPTSGWLFNVGDFSQLIGSLSEKVVQEWLEETGVKGARAIARHLLPPALNEKGEPILPPLTGFVLSHFGNDEGVFSAFVAGTHSGQVYSGDIATEHLKEAAVARSFLAHPIPRVREWAEHEIQFANNQAAHWRQRDEEQAAP
ncbi:MAG TPA: hypothetical protein VGE74_07385, partial [Gemmata sp.]